MADLVVRPLAEADIDEAFAWYEGRSVSLGVDFLRAVDASFDAITATPLGYPLVYRIAPSSDGSRTPCSTWSTMTAWRFLHVRIPDSTRVAGDGGLDA